MYYGPIYPDTGPPDWEESCARERRLAELEAAVEDAKRKEDQRLWEFNLRKRLARLPAYRRKRKVKNKAAAKARRISRE